MQAVARAGLGRATPVARERNPYHADAPIRFSRRLLEEDSTVS